MAASSASHYKGKDPSVDINTLQNKWTPESRVLYIGKAGGANQATHLQTRFRAYVRFGQGSHASHWGGRYLWQIENIDECFVAFKIKSNAAEMETALLKQHKDKFGKLPFANLRG